MSDKNTIRAEEERRRTIKYGNNDVSSEYVSDVLHCGALYSTLNAAERNKTDKKTNAAIPSDMAVADLRHWSEYSQL